MGGAGFEEVFSSFLVTGLEEDNLCVTKILQ